MIQEQFKILRAGRKNIISVLNSYDNQDLNRVPKGYKNNLIWNAGHVLVTQQSLIYGLSGCEIKIDMNLVALFKKGSAVDSVTSHEQVTLVKKELMDTVSVLEKDFENNIFDTFSPYLTSYGYRVFDITSAISFNNLHEALHLGYMMAMKKQL